MSLLRGLKGFVGLALVASVITAHPAILRAQTTSASVSGTVQDSQGGVLPGVTVTLTSRTQGNALDRGYRRGRTFRVPHRPSRYLLAPGRAPGLQDARADERGRERQRQALGRIAHAGSRQRWPKKSASRRASIELQSNSGERSFTLESESLKNIASNGRMLFNFATLVPGALSQDTGGTELGSVSGFTVNGQRPNSNNITIDGVANIDTGDNGGNMATTNIDSVAEFKILTNAYQAEYGRAVGGQLQVVTKSGTQSFHGSGYWYGRRSDWDANTYLNKREHAGDPEAEDLAQRLRLHDRRTGRVPGFQRRQEEAVLLLEPGIPAAHEPAERCIRRACRRRSSGAAISRRASTAAAIRSRTFATSRTGLPCSAADTRGCFQDGGVLGRIPANRLYAPGLAALNIFPHGELLGRQRPELHEPGSRTAASAAKSCCAWTSRPPTTGGSPAAT